jgi:DNA-binding CsgD family transcriptional regulator/PAS domain-containing protein
MMRRIFFALGSDGTARQAEGERMPQRSVHALITDLYDAAMETSVWGHLGARLATALGGQTSALWIVEHGHVREMISSLPAEAVALYQQYYHALDPWAALASRTPRLQALVGPELVPQRVVLASEFYNDWGAQFGVCHVVGAVVPLDARATATLGLALERPCAADAFTEADRQRLNVVLPHLQRAVQLRRRLGHLEAQAQVGFAALDALPLGVVVAAADGAIVFANTAAEGLARRDEGLRLGGRLSGLGAVQPLEAQRLRGLVYAVTHGEAGGMLRITRRTQPPLAVLVAPLPTRLHPAMALAPSLALVLITDPANGPVLTAQALQQLFALTAAEASVALALAAGRSAEDIAAEREVSLPTVRTQIRQILEKTGARHLRDLVRLLAALPAERPPRDHTMTAEEAS